MICKHGISTVPGGTECLSCINQAAWAPSGGDILADLQRASERALRDTGKRYESADMPAPPGWVSGKEHAALKAELAEVLESRNRCYVDISRLQAEVLELSERVARLYQDSLRGDHRRANELADKCGELELDLGAAHKRIGALEREIEKLKGVR